MYLSEKSGSDLGPKKLKACLRLSISMLHFPFNSLFNGSEDSPKSISAKKESRKRFRKLFLRDLNKTVKKIRLKQLSNRLLQYT